MMIFLDESAKINEGSILSKKQKTMTKLYDIPNGSKIYCGATDGSAFIIFDHLDGLYSHCTTEKGSIVHLRASTPLEVFEGGYKIAEEPAKSDDDRSYPDDEYAMKEDEERRKEDGTF